MLGANDKTMPMLPILRACNPSGSSRCIWSKKASVYSAGLQRSLQWLTSMMSLADSASPDVQSRMERLSTTSFPKFNDDKSSPMFGGISARKCSLSRVKIEVSEMLKWNLRAPVKADHPVEFKDRSSIQSTRLLPRPRNFIITGLARSLSRCHPERQE